MKVRLAYPRQRNQNSAESAQGAEPQGNVQENMEGCQTEHVARMERESPSSQFPFCCCDKHCLKAKWEEKD